MYSRRAQHQERRKDQKQKRQNSRQWPQQRAQWSSQSQTHQSEDLCGGIAEQKKEIIRTSVAYKPKKWVCHENYGKRTENVFDNHSGGKMDRQTRKAFEAVWQGDLKALKRSLRKMNGSDVNARWRTKLSGKLGGKTMLHSAVMASNVQAVQLLLAQPQIDTTASFVDALGECWTPLTLAEMHGNHAVLHALRTHMSPEGIKHDITERKNVSMKTPCDGQTHTATADQALRAMEVMAIDKETASHCEMNKENAWRDALQSNLPSHNVWNQSKHDSECNDMQMKNETTRSATPFSLFSKTIEVEVPQSVFSINSWLDEVSLARESKTSEKLQSHLLRPQDLLNIDKSSISNDNNEETDDDEDSPMGMAMLSAGNNQLLTKRSFTIDLPHKYENHELHAHKRAKPIDNYTGCGWSEEALSMTDATLPINRSQWHSQSKVSPPPGFGDVSLTDSTNTLQTKEKENEKECSTKKSSMKYLNTTAASSDGFTFNDVSSNGNDMKSLTRTQRRRVQRIRAKHQRRMLQATLAASGSCDGTTACIGGISARYSGNRGHNVRTR